MTSRVEAGRLSHVDLGTTVEVGDKSGQLVYVRHIWCGIGVDLQIGIHRLDLDPHTLVTITGKEAEA